MRSQGSIKADNGLDGKAVVCKSTAPSEEEICTKSKYAFRASVGYATAAAEEISGDTAISCGLPDGSLALILSDGMGKGIRAAADSRTVVRRLRRNLKSGQAPAAAIKEVNSYMIAHESGEKAESFATLDLLIIDRRGGKAKFYKMGAASSFLVRGRTVRSFEKAALPVGIIPKLQTGQITFRLHEGDTLVMVSDGITEADSGDLTGTWLTELLKEICSCKEHKSADDSISARQLARTIMQEAATRCVAAEGDDRTVAVVKILPCRPALGEAYPNGRTHSFAPAK